MKKNNKYTWLFISSIVSFVLISVIHSHYNKMNVTSEITYPLKVIDNEILCDSEVLYRFIPIDGGPMVFSYEIETEGSSRDSFGNIEKIINDTLFKSNLKEVQSFLIGETPITLKLWNIVMDDDYIKGLGDFFIPLYVCNKKEKLEEFIVKLNQLTGREFAIPDNYQWEYAARGGQKSQNFIYAGSNKIGEVAFYKENYNFIDVTSLGKQKKPNELGLYDMSGGVWELTSTSFSDMDIILPDSFKNIPVIRGGYCGSPANECQTRNWGRQIYPLMGLRLIMKN